MEGKVIFQSNIQLRTHHLITGVDPLHMVLPLASMET